MGFENEQENNTPPPDPENSVIISPENDKKFSTVQLSWDLLFLCFAEIIYLFFMWVSLNKLKGENTKDWGILDFKLLQKNRNKIFLNLVCYKIPNFINYNFNFFLKF